MLAASRHNIGARKGTRRPWALYRNALFGLAWFRDKGEIWRPGAGFGRRSPPITATGRGYRRTHRSGTPGIKSSEPLKGIVSDHRWQGRDADRCRRKTTVAKRLSHREGQRFVVREEAHDFIVDESSACAADSEEAAATTD